MIESSLILMWLLEWMEAIWTVWKHPRNNINPHLVSVSLMELISVGDFVSLIQTLTIFVSNFNGYFYVANNHV